MVVVQHPTGIGRNQANNRIKGGSLSSAVETHDQDEHQSRRHEWRGLGPLQDADQLLLQRKPQLMNIYVQLAFAYGNSTDEIIVEQWGVANVQLKGAYLDQWFKDKDAKDKDAKDKDAKDKDAKDKDAKDKDAKDKDKPKDKDK